MPEFNEYIYTRDGIKDALRRNKMQADRTIGLPAKAEKSEDPYFEFLQHYIFKKKKMTPLQLLHSMEYTYAAEQDFRDRRQTNIDFTRGRQFNQLVYDEELGRHITQLQYLKRRNIPPLTYNVISKLNRSLVGQFREVNTGNVVKCESKDIRGQELANYLTMCLQRIKNKSNAKQKDARNMKEMLQSGRPVFKVLVGSKNNMTKPDVKYRIVNTPRFGINPGVTDEDMANLHTIYEIHDTDLNSIVNMFAKGDYKRGMEIENAYIKYEGDHNVQASYSHQSFDGTELRNQTFYTSGVGYASHRYYEVWMNISSYEAATYDPLEVVGNKYKVHKWRDPEKVRKEIEEVNKLRIENAQGDIAPEKLQIQMDVNFRSRWYVAYLTPWGYVLDVRESPYKNGGHPYVFPAPELNGEMWGLIEEVLNAQLSLDRQILQADNIINNASKGVWLIPEKAVPDDMSRREYRREIKKADGAVFVKLEDGQRLADVLPQQQYAQAANVSNNVQQLIQMYSGLVDEISGNYGAAQGKETGGAGKTATGYALESQNAGLNVRDTFETYLDVLLQRDEKLLMFITELYNQEDYSDILGDSVIIDPKELAKYEFSIEQSKGTNSPAHRLALEQELLQLVYNGLMPFEVFLDISNNPVMIQAKQKLQEFNKMQAMAGQMQQQISGAGAQMFDQNGTPVDAEVLQAQGHPQNKLLTDSPVRQELGKLPLIPTQNIIG